MRITTVFFAMIVFAGCAYPSKAAEKPNILIMGEDSDTDSVPRKSQVFKRVLNALSNQLSDEGFDVYDETAVTLDGFTQGRVRRTDAELIDIARSVKRPPIDVTTIFTIYGVYRKLSYTTKVSSRVEGRLLNVRTGQRLGNFEVELPSAQNVPRNCNRVCMTQAVGKQARELAEELGAILTAKLSHIVKDTATGSSTNLPSAYTLIFSGFKEEEVDEIEDNLVTFSGYKKYRPVEVTMRKAEYWYQTGSDSARLNRNLRKMLRHMGVKGRITFSGSKFSIKKITFRK